MAADYMCKICGKIVMSKEYCIKTEDRTLRFCCERCMDKYQKQEGQERLK